MTEIACSLQPDLDRKKSKKKKNKLKQTLSDSVESSSQNITVNTSEQSKESADSSRLTFPSVSDKSVVMPNDHGTSKKKKKKNKKKRSIIDGVSARGEAETEDAAESIDSGCIPDGPPEIAELTDWQQVETVLLEENQFVSHLLQWLPVPEGEESMETEDTESTGGVKRANEGEDEPPAKRYKNKAELQTLHEKLRKDLEDLKMKRKKIPWDQWLKNRESKLSKKLKNVKKTDKRQKSKMKGDWNPTEADKDAKATKKTKKHKLDPHSGHEMFAKKGGGGKKPIYNNKGKLVFSKFDFSSPTTGSDPDTHKSKDLKQMLSQALKEKEKAKWLEHKGEKKQAANLVEQRAWAGALQKAEGIKVKDNVALLKKSIKRKEATKLASQKKWEGRLQNVERKKAEKDMNRKKNLKVRKDQKKTKKLDKMKKKGHIVPGF